MDKAPDGMDFPPVQIPVRNALRTRDGPPQGLVLAPPLSYNSRMKHLPEIQLPPPRFDSRTSVESALRQRRSVREFIPKPLPLAHASQLLWAAQGVTGTEGQRTAPSAGALYPLELLAVAGTEGELPAGIFRYRPSRHDLVLVVSGDRRRALAAAALGQGWVAQAPLTLAIAAVLDRTAGKYGPRARRYVDMEAGHAAQNIHLQAVALELGTVVVGAFDDAEVGKVLGLGAHEQPLCLMPIGRARL